MIQRVQTLYLGICIVLLSIVTFGSTVFSYVSETARYSFSSYGISTYDLDTGNLVDHQHFPFYLGTIALILFAFLCMMAYKDLKRQFKLGRTLFFLYFVMLVSVVLISIFGDSLLSEEVSKRELGLGFYLFVMGFPFTFLANTGIKRDKNLLDSLNRLR